MSLLEVKNLSLRFGGLTAVNDVSLVVNPGQIFSVIGPNGAGKTSLFNAISGIYEPTEGSVRLHGREVQRAFCSRTALGIALVGLFSFLGSLISVNLEAFWERTITANYVYQEAFPWMKASIDGLNYFVEALSGPGIQFPLVCGILGLVGGFVVWSRARRSPEAVACTGIARTFQNIRLFPEMSAMENILVGMDRRLQCGILPALFRLPGFGREKCATEARARELLQFVDLQSQAEIPAANLPYGHQRRLEIARALASDPILLLLDEPAAGMNPSEAEDLMILIRKIKDRGVTIMLIEHHMRVVMGISDRISVLDYGNKIAEGTPEEIRKDPKVIAAYLGKTE